MKTTAFFQNGSAPREIVREDLERILATPEQDVWIDVMDPDPELLDMLEAFLGQGITLDDLENALAGRERPRIETHPQCYVVVWYTARYDPNTTNIPAEPLLLIIGPKFLLTLHRTACEQVQETLIRWHDPESPLECRVGPAVYALLDAIIDEYYPTMDNVAGIIDDIEDDVFEQPTVNPIQKIFALKKSLLQFRRIVAPQRDVINMLLRRDLPVFRSEDMPYLQDLYNRLVRMAETVDLYRDLLSSGLDSYISMQSNRLNEVIKVLTVASIVLMTNALIAGIYGMNFDFMPELHWTFGYPLALLLMAGITAFLILFFRRKNWL
jgi:magnesium transporter